MVRQLFFYQKCHYKQKKTKKIYRKKVYSNYHISVFFIRYLIPETNYDFYLIHCFKKKNYITAGNELKYSTPDNQVHRQNRDQNNCTSP